jgi:hypothetical protein
LIVRYTLILISNYWNFVFFYVILTTLLLVVVTTMSDLNFSFSWIFYITFFGQFIVLIVVYKVLTDNYSITKTFDDFYEDKLIKKEKTIRNKKKMLY